EARLPHPGRASAQGALHARRRRPRGRERDREPASPHRRRPRRGADRPRAHRPRPRDRLARCPPPPGPLVSRRPPTTHSQRTTPISQAKDIRINEGIRVREVRVVGADGSQLGILPIAAALETARQQELDLVEVAPDAAPPVCRIMDFGKYKYTQARRLKEARK